MHAVKMKNGEDSMAAEARGGESEREKEASLTEKLK